MNISNLVRAAALRRLLATAASLGMAALTATALIAPSAQASSATPGDFSSLIAGNPTAGWLVDDCYVELGYIYDSVPYPNYRHIGGVRVNCNSRHSYIAATVAMYYYNGSSWVQYGNGKYGIKYNVTGSGSGISGILETPAYCAGTLRADYWIVGATVSTERASRTVYSQVPAHDPNAGC
jgi:hypothetical protein